MKIIIAVIVYNRFYNVKLWVDCWKQCEQHNAELVIIHNYYGDEAEKKKFSEYCKKEKVKYIARNAPGYDIGAFQDVCKQRLTGFDNNWDLLMWCCDDTIPISRDFILPYLNKFTGNIGVVCMDLSAYVKTHIRTTGFMVNKQTALKLTFNIDPVTTKEDCYQFEHRSRNSFYEQVLSMQGGVAQVEAREKSPLWDAGYHRRLHRGKEHHAAFPKKGKVVFICPIFDAFPEIISSLMCQTWSDWELLLICDNPGKSNNQNIINTIGDARIKYIHKERSEKWGHPFRQWALKEMDGLCPNADYVVITNGDNYHIPVYCEYMIKGFIENPQAVAVYCEDMIHSYVAWEIINCRPERGFMDCAGVMVRRDVSCVVGWRDVDNHSADWTYFNDIITRYGKESFIRIEGCLLVHN